MHLSVHFWNQSPDLVSIPVRLFTMQIYRFRNIWKSIWIQFLLSWLQSCLECMSAQLACKQNHFKRVLFPQHDQLYTWAAVNQPTHSLESLEGKLPGQLKGHWPPRPGGDNKTRLRSTEAGKNNTYACSLHIQYITGRLVDRADNCCQ